jgi:glutamate synthase (NADPH/NADH) small chain
VPRDLPVSGRELGGVHFALEFLIPQNKEVAGDKNPINVKGKHVVVIGGGDTGSDCVGTSNRHGAASVTQFELMPMPPEQENKALTWPYWPSSCAPRPRTTKAASATGPSAPRSSSVKNGKVKALKAVRLEWKDGRMSEVAGSEFEIPADSCFLAMGFTQSGGRRARSLRRRQGQSRQRQGQYRGRPAPMRPMFPACSPPATCAVASRWWSGPYAKDGSAHAPWTSS